jgi:hypothetical protein
MACFALTCAFCNVEGLVTADEAATARRESVDRTVRQRGERNSH